MIDYIDSLYLYAQAELRTSFHFLYVFVYITESIAVIAAESNAAAIFFFKC